MEFGATLSPLVTVSGVPNFKSKQEGPGDLGEHDRIVICEKDVEDSPVINTFSRKLLALSRPSTPWDSKASKLDHLNFHFTNEVLYPSKSIKPSAISPKNPSCEAPIFTHKWIQKYTKWVPSVSIVLCSIPNSEKEEDGLISTVLALRKTLARYGTYIICVLIGKDDALAQIAPYVRRQTGFSRSELLALSDDLNDTEIDAFVKSVFDNTLLLSNEFFTNKLRTLREKRNAVEPPLDLLIWDARFTLKLAYCSEFKGDMASAIKLYESAYDSLALLFENQAISVHDSSYQNARQILDVVAMKIFQHSLPSRQALDKLNVHIAAGEQVWSLNHIGPKSQNALRWRAIQHAQFAQFCTIVKQAGTSSAALAQQPSGLPTGLIWLDAAKAFAAESHLEPSEIDDPYTPFYTESSSLTDFSPQHVFLNAISELSGFRRAKAYALVEYGKWLSKEDPDAASQAFQSARQSLSQNVWPEVQRLIGTHLKDKFSLFTLGDHTDFNHDVEKDANKDTPLFECSGTFETSETHIGREVRAQVTLSPKFSGKLTMEGLTIKHSIGSVSFKHAENISDSYEYLTTASHGDDTATPANLNFGDNASRTFQFSVTSIDIGDVELLNAEWHTSSSFSQSLPIENITDAWLLTSAKPGPKTLKHLQKKASSLKVHVKTRPAKLEIVDYTPSIVAAGEKLKFSFELRSQEDEDIVPHLEVVLISETEGVSELSRHEEDLKISAHGSFVPLQGECSIPATSPCEILVTARFNTSTDTLPVHFEFRKNLDVVKPFRVTFDVVPVYFPQQWPAVFAPTLSLEQIPRKWRLDSSILSLFNNSDVMLHLCKTRLESESAAFEIEDADVQIGEVMHYNNIKTLSQRFLSRVKTEDGSTSVRNFEAFAHVSLVWSRKSDLDTRNEFLLPPLRLNLPTQEPRALVIADVKGVGPETSQVTYHIENATAKMLNFSISMASSTYFAFQGPKSINLRLLPFSTRALAYQLTPLGDGAVQNKRPLPELRIFDINYKRTLAVLPGDRLVSFEQGTLFL